MIVIVDYGMGNLESIRNMLRRIGARAEVTGDPEQVARATRIVLPGVGAFDAAMKRIDEAGLRDVLDHKALVDRIPCLGICLGMQLLTRGSQEGKQRGLGWIAASTYRFQPTDGLKVPHMGWNLVHRSGASPLTVNFEHEDEVRFYFVHSYYVRVDDERHSILKANYGVEFDAAVQQDNIFGAQFHPEKSHRFGMRMFQNFLEV